MEPQTPPDPSPRSWPRARIGLVVALLATGVWLLGRDGSDDGTRDRGVAHDTEHAPPPGLVGRMESAEEALRRSPGERPPDVKEAPKQAASGSPVKGRVLDTAGKPVVDAIVCIHGRRHARSDPSGRFELALTPGAHKVEVNARGTLPALRTVNAPSPGQVAEEVEFVLHPGLTIEGRVLDSGDRPRAGMRVLAWPSVKTPPVLMYWTSDQALLGHDVFTGPDGRFVLHGLKPVPHEVLVSVASSPVWEPVSTYAGRVMPGGPPVEFRLRDRGRARGVVADAETGIPIVAFTVNGIPQYDQKGLFDVPVHEALLIRAPGYVVGFRWLDEGGATEGTQRITLRPAEGSVTARVVLVDETGAKLRHAQFATGHDASFGPRWTVFVPVPRVGYPLPVVPGRDEVVVRTQDGRVGSVTVPADFTDGSALLVHVNRAGADVPLRVPPPANPQHHAQLLIEASDGSVPAWCFVPESPYTLMGVHLIVWTPDGLPTAIALFDSHEDGIVERDVRSLSREAGVEAFVGCCGTQAMIVGWRGRLTGLPPGAYKLTLRTRLDWKRQESVWQRSFTVGETWSAPVLLEPTDRKK